MISLQCAICKNKEKIFPLYKENFDIKKINQKIFSARRTPDRIHYRLIKCQRCGLIFSNPILEPEKIYSLYSKSEFSYDLESKYLKKTYGFYLTKIIPKDNRERLKLLDIGCGNGFFLEEARRLGIRQLCGVEPSKSSVDNASKWLKKNIKVDIFRPGLFKKNSFDIICCFHTLDHVVNPNLFLKEAYALLRKGGKALFIVHNTDGLSVKLFGENSPIFDIEHIYLFNPKTLSKIFSKNRFKKIKVFDVKNTYPLFYWIRLSPMPFEIKKMILGLLSLGKIGFLPLSLSAGNIGIIAKK